MRTETKTILDSLLENVGDMALKRRARKIIEELDPKRGEKILEVGCGDGFYLHLLSSFNLNLKLYGADYDPNALKTAERNLSGRKVKILQADLMDKLPFKSSSFDKVVMSEVLEHLPSDIKGLSEVKRVLKPGGVIIMTVPNARYPFLWDPINWTLEHTLQAHFRSGFWAGIWNQHHRLYKSEELTQVVNMSGLKVKMCEAVTFWSLPFNHFLLNFAAIKLHAGGFSPEVSSAIDKFSVSAKRPLFIQLAYNLVNVVDKLNTHWTPSKTGVGIIVKLQK